MDDPKLQHGRLLARAMRIAGLDRDQIAGLTNRGVRTVSHWTAGQTMPSEEEKALLRARLGPYDRYPDLVEFAIRISQLTDDRADAVAGYYKKMLREQREGRSEVS
jgi:hypothetical protein